MEEEENRREKDNERGRELWRRKLEEHGGKNKGGETWGGERGERKIMGEEEKGEKRNIRGKEEEKEGRKGKHIQRDVC